MKYDIKTCLDEDKMNMPKITFQYPEFETDEEVNISKSRVRRNEDKTSEDKLITEEEKQEDQKNNKKLTILLISLIALVIIIIGVLFFVSNGNKVKSVEIPDVSTLSEKEAKKELKNLGLKVVIKRTADDNIESGKVIKTSPRAGKNIKKNAKITLYISSGLDGIEVINYVGKDIDMVEQELKTKGIVVSKTEEEHSKDDVDIKENIILAQDVEVGTKLSKGDKITFTIPKIVPTYPDFVKEVYTLEEVEKFCKENGCTVVPKEKESNTDKAGTVIYQSRDAGTKVVKGASITITVAKAPENVVITKIELNQNNVTLAVSNTVKLSATITPSTATNPTINWSSSNQTVATVDSSGTVKGLSAGTATITAASADGSNVKATATITVTGSAPEQQPQQ